MIILDSDVLIEIYDKESVLGDRLVTELENSREEYLTTPINIHEVFYSLLKYAGKSEYVEQFPTLPFTGDDALLSAKLAYSCEKVGNPVEKEDCMIAAIAINNNAKIFTLNRKHFDRFKEFGLKLFD
jgi:predicted nucleic acid-binding protein